MSWVALEKAISQKKASDPCNQYGPGMVKATPPNEEGYCSLGVSCDYAKAAIRAAKTVIIDAHHHCLRVIRRKEGEHCLLR